MLVYNTSVAEAVTHVYYVIASEICRQIIQELGCTEFFANKIYIDSFVHGPSKSYNHVNKRPILNESCFRCEIKYNCNPFSLKWDSTIPGQHLDPMHHRRDTLNTIPLFYHPEANIQVIERYIPCNLDLECELVFMDRVKAMDIMTRLVTRYAKGEFIMLNNLSYNYAFPKDVLVRLKALSSFLGIPDDKFIDWLKEFSNNQISLILSKRQRNQSKEVVVKKYAFEALSSIGYDVNQPNVVSNGSSPNTFSINFNLTAQFARINLLYMKYPIIINNTFVPEELLSINKKDEIGPTVEKLQHPYLRLNAFRNSQFDNINQPVRNPWYDDWKVPQNSIERHFKYDTFFVGAFTLDLPEEYVLTEDKTAQEDITYYTFENGVFTELDLYEDDPLSENTYIKNELTPNNTYTEIDLSDLDQYQLTDKVLNYYKSNPNDVFVSNGAYHISVYEGDVMVEPSLLRLEGTVLKIPNSLRIMKEHRIVLSKGSRNIGVDQPFRVLDCIILVQNQ